MFSWMGMRVLVGLGEEVVVGGGDGKMRTGGCGGFGRRKESG